MKSITSTHLAAAAIALFLALAFIIGGLTTQRAGAAAYAGAAATVATTSLMTVNTTPSLVMATSSCSARIVSTQASPVMIGFSDRQGFLPNGLQGHLQAASTTVGYDSGLYGCEAMRVYSYVAGTITITETR